MYRFKIVIVFLIACIYLSCSQENRDHAMMEKAETSQAEATTDTIAAGNGFVSSSAAVEDKKDTTHKFIRTANLKFKVKDVIQATYRIEDITRQQGGFVTYTNLNSQVNDSNTTPINADSTLETTFYMVTNTMTLRVPNTKLDTTLKQIAKTIDYLDYRIIQAEDVALQLLSNNLSQKRAAQNEARLNRVLESGKKQWNDANTAESIGSQQEHADAALLSNLSLKDQMQFSTVQLSIYQRQTAKRELIANYKNIDAYEPSLGSKLLEALKTGWNVLTTILVFLTQLWGLFLFGIVAYVLYRKFRHKFKS